MLSSEGNNGNAQQLKKQDPLYANGKSTRITLKKMQKMT